MATHYTPYDEAYLRAKAQREGRKWDEELVLCSDGIFRTQAEKECFERAAEAQIKVLKHG